MGQDVGEGRYFSDREYGARPRTREVVASAFGADFAV